MRNPYAVHPSVLVAVAVLLVVGGFGCSQEGSGRVAVSGTVSLNGSPLEKGSIVFEPIRPTRGPRAGGEILDGKYRLQAENGPVAGSHRVRIWANATDRLPYDITDPREYLKHGPTRIPPNPVPSRYNETSDLEVRTEKGKDNEFEFDLKNDSSV